MTDLLVVGGGAAGFAAAQAFRAAGGDGAVRIVSSDDRAPYDRPPLSKDFLRGEVDESSPLADDGWYADHAVELTLLTSVERLDAARQMVWLSTGASLSYDTCVLATGGSPTQIPVPGADHPGVHTLRSALSGGHLRAHAGAVKSAIVIGSGFIGCEAAASLAVRGLSVTMISQEEQPQAERLGTYVGGRIVGWLSDLGVDVVGGAEIVSIEDGRRVVLSDGSAKEAALVLLAAGSTPRSGIADEAGLRMHEGRVVVDHSMRTGSPGLFAAGDIAHADNAAARRHLSVEHWGEAERMGEIAGTVAAGGHDSWAQVPGFWSEIADHTVKYAAWGDGFDDVDVHEHDDGGFTAWYGLEGRTVGVLTYEADDDYERGSELVESGSALPRSER